MGSILGGGGSGGGGLFGGGGGGGDGLLGNLLGGLPDPLGLGKMLFGFGADKEQGGAPPPGPQQPSGVQYAPQPGQPPSGVSFNPSQMLNSPMGPTGMGIGGGNRGR